MESGIPESLDTVLADTCEQHGMGPAAIKQDMAAIRACNAWHNARNGYSGDCTGDCSGRCGALSGRLVALTIPADQHRPPIALTRSQTCWRCR